MAGVYLEITRDTATPAVASAHAALEGDELQLMLDDIGFHLVNSTRDRRERQVSPDGTPFEPLNPEYARKKRQTHPGRTILERDEHMIFDQFSHQVVGDELFVGTNAIYGAMHQFGGRGNIPGVGWRHIPARPWLGLSEQDRTDVLDIAREHVEGWFRG